MEFRASRATYRAFVGGRGAGKTFVGSYDMLRRARRDCTYMIASPTSIIMGDTTFPTFVRMASQYGFIRPGCIKVTPYPTITLSTGATIRFRTAEDPERLRGPNLSGVWLDEGSLMAREAFDIVIACLREGGEQGWLSNTFTPKGLTHWTYEYFGKSRPDTELFHASTKQNPFLPADFAHTLQQQYGEGSHLAGQELDGLFLSTEGAEWPPHYFDDHLWFDDWPDPSHFTVRCLALDPAQGKKERGGFTRQQAAANRGCYASFVFAALCPEDGTIWTDTWMSKDWDATALVRHMLDLTRHYHPQICSVETNGGQEFLVHLLMPAARQQGLHLPLFGLNNTREKEMRIRDLGPFLAQRKLRIRRTPGGELLVNQLRDFPQAEYKDGPDALEMAVRLVLYCHRQHEAQGGLTPIAV